MLPRPQEVVLRWEHRVVQIILQIVRRRRQVSRDLGGASHWPRYRDYRRRRTARRCFWQCLRCSQGCRTRIVPATRSSCREKKGKGEFHQQGKDLIIFLFTTQTKFYKIRIKIQKTAQVFLRVFSDLASFGNTSCATVIYWDLWSYWCDNFEVHDIYVWWGFGSKREKREWTRAWNEITRSEWKAGATGELFFWIPDISLLNDPYD